MKMITPVLALTFLAFTAPLAYGSDAQQQEINKNSVVAFYEQAINQKDFAAAQKYMGSRYTQHNPMAQDGPQGLQGYISFLREKFPNSHSDIKHVFADGDYVILHVHAVLDPGTRGQAIMDIFKLDKGKIIEHWDVIQDIPERPANSNGMF